MSTTRAATPARDEAPTAALRDLVRRAGYTGDGIREALSTAGDIVARGRDVPVHVRRLEGRDDALAVLIRLFALGIPEDANVADSALAPLGANGLEQLRVVRRDADRVVATVRIIPHDELLIASDHPEAETGYEHVPGVQRPSVTLGNLTVRRRAHRALDMGTGNGIQALLLAQHADEVVATDVNVRALEFARFNALLNGVSNVEVREGSFFEPVAGERFDVIATNPPYVISPETALVFRDSGLGRDRVSEEVVRALPEHLDEGAFATVMVSWVADPDDPLARPLSWLQGSGCDAWLFHTRVDDPLESASSWNRDAGDDFEASVDRWVRYYREEGIEALGYGAIVIRRRDGENWVRAATMPPGRLNPASAHVERMFAAQELLAHDDEELLDRRYAFVPRARLVHELAYERDAWRIADAVLSLEEGLGFRASLDAVTGAITARTTPERAYREILSDVGQERGIDKTSIATGGVRLLRQMLELGFVVPAD